MSLVPNLDCGEAGQPGWAVALLLSLSLNFSFQQIERGQIELREEAMEKNKIMGHFCMALWNISTPTKVVLTN